MLFSAKYPYNMSNVSSKHKRNEQLTITESPSNAQSVIPAKHALAFIDSKYLLEEVL